MPLKSLFWNLIGIQWHFRGITCWAVDISIICYIIAGPSLYNFPYVDRQGPPWKNTKSKRIAVEGVSNCTTARFNGHYQLHNAHISLATSCQIKSSSAAQRETNFAPLICFSVVLSYTISFFSFFLSFETQKEFRTES